MLTCVAQISITERQLHWEPHTQIQCKFVPNKNLMDQ